MRSRLKKKNKDRVQFLSAKPQLVARRTRRARRRALSFTTPMASNLYYFVIVAKNDNPIYEVEFADTVKA